ncbi:MAG: TonB family protein [Bacteroidia bacterium]|nr:TonB family protein [Bacteroidia bacterium]
MKKNDVILADLNEIIFEGRNKNYGGYVIRKDHNKYLATGLAIVMSLLLLYVIWFLSNRQLNPVSGPDLSGLITLMEVNTEDFVVPKVEDKIEAAIENPIEESGPADDPMQGTTETKYDNVNPKKDAPENSTMTLQDSLVGNPSDRDKVGNDSAGVMGNKADSSKSKNPTIVKKAENKAALVDPDINDPFLDLEEIPSTLNMDKLKKEMGFPAQAREIGMEGKVIFRILVDENGNYKDHKTIYSSHKIFENHVAPHLKKLKFKPGKQAGHPVRVWINIPFQFHLMR